ncbi:2-hydroxy-6-oxononadienedioate/2-hydroxy-6-oxononatrienedioate hydrolase [Nymphaea thermarum]|nr:2-hydroxy-6-oxononadienedioate/2-hydroxy-6-oxononatrienedioate hydrolase [Nymphaea thermarum]
MSWGDEMRAKTGHFEPQLDKDIIDGECDCHETSLLENCILSSCVKPLQRTGGRPVVLLHGFDREKLFCFRLPSSCLEWRYTFPLLEDTGLETWAVDVLGWGFSDLEQLPPCNATSKREHLYQFFRSYITRPLVLVGASLGAAVAIDFAVNYPEFVSELVLIDASVYAEGTGRLSRLPRPVAYAGVSLLKSIPLRLVASLGMYNNSSLSTIVDRTSVSLLHCLLPWWDDATVDFMLSGGYNIIADINQVKQKTLIIWGEDDRIISSKFAKRLQQDIPNSILHMIPDCGHVPHIEKPNAVARLILDFVCKKDS